MDTNQIGGKILGKGSFGYVYKPGFKCNQQKGINKNNVTKVFFSEESVKEAKDELFIDNKIKQIKGYNQWCHIWTSYCNAPQYDKLHKLDKDIEESLNDSNMSKSQFDKYSKMLQGTYGGVDLRTKMETDFTKDVFDSPTKFTHVFLNLMKLMKPLFMGLVALHTNEISHNDIKADNIMVDDTTGCKYIDFGLASHYSNDNFFKKRGMSEFACDRVYPPYPYEFIYLYANKELLEEEKEAKKLDIYRELHDRYVQVHEGLFKRMKTKHYTLTLINRYIKEITKINKYERNGIIAGLDTYGLGMLIPRNLWKLAKKYNKVSKLRELLYNTKLRSFTELFYVMTEPNHYDRIGPQEAYRRYLELEKLYLSKPTIKHIKKLFNEFDEDNSGKIDYNEFKHGMENNFPSKKPKKKK
jgi:serine/threonine protein kinase